MITAYMKPTNYCNVGCTHCYLPESVRANKTRMSWQTLEDTAALLADMARAGRHRGAHILWHGGEPMTVPVAWYWQAAELFDARLPGHFMTMQSSLIPYRDDFAPLITQRFGSEIGSSIDFSQRRIKGKVENYHKLWMDKVERCRGEGILVIPGVVPTRAEIGREAELVDWFIARDFALFNIDRYNAYNTHFDDRPDNAAHARFLIGLFDALMARFEARGRAPLVGAIKAAITGVVHGVGGDRWGGSCQSDFVVVEPDGALNTCPDKSTVEAPHAYAHEGFKAFAGSWLRRKWIRHQNLDHKKNHCMSCENNTWCRSGCPITGNGTPDGETECSGYKSFITHVRRYVEAGGRDAVLAYIDQLSRIGASPMSLSPYETGHGETAAGRAPGAAA